MADIKYLDKTGLGTIKSILEGLYATKGHNHDTRYYLKTEIDNKLDGKADSHTHIIYSAGEGLSLSNGTFSLNIASTTVRGGIFAASVRSTSVAPTTGSTASGRYYGVEVDSGGKAFVNVPWTDNNNIYTAGTGLSLSNGQFSLKTASSTSKGGIYAASTRTTTASLITGGNTSGRYYGVEVDGTGTAFVHVPWTDNNNTYSAGNGLTLNNGTFSLNIASPSARGGIYAAAVRSTTISPITGGATSDRYYGVEVDSGGKAFVNVPWTDNNNTYSAGNGLTLSNGTFNLNIASTSARGGIIAAAVRSTSPTLTTGGTTSDRYYGVEIGANNKAFVHVPWTDNNNTYTAGNGLTLSNGQFSLNIATANNRGGIIAAAVRSTAISPAIGGTTTGRYYGVEVDSTGKAFVHVPWTGGTCLLTDDDQEIYGTKTFVNGIRIGDDSDPDDSYEVDRTIYFGDNEYTAISETPADSLTIRGNNIHFDTDSSISTKPTYPTIDNYATTSSSNYTASSVYSTSIPFVTNYSNKSTRDAVSASSTNLYISGTTQYTSYSIGAGQTLKLDLGVSYQAYMYTRTYDTYMYCSSCGREYDMWEIFPTNLPNVYIEFYLTTSSSSTSAISGTTRTILLYEYSKGYSSDYQSGSANAPGYTTALEYTNTGSSSTTVYLKARIKRDSSNAVSFEATSGYWRIKPEGGSYWEYYPVCPNCDSSYSTSYYNQFYNYLPGGSYTQYFSTIRIFRKSTTYKKATFSFPNISTGNITLYNQGLAINPSETAFNGSKIAYNSSAAINSTNCLCYKFPNKYSGLFVDENSFNYFIGGTSDISSYAPEMYLNINADGLRFYQNYSSSSSSYDSYKTTINDAVIKLESGDDYKAELYSCGLPYLKLNYIDSSGTTTGVTINYNNLDPATNGGFRIGSSSRRVGTIYSTASLNTSSDERFKDWKGDIEIDFDKLKTLPKKLFTWKDCFLKDDDNIHIGTSAQVLRELYPELVHIFNDDVELCAPRDIYDPDAILSVEYDKLGVIALAAIDKLHEENVELKNKLETVEQEKEELKTRLDALEELLKSKGII